MAAKLGLFKQGTSEE